MASIQHYKDLICWQKALVLNEMVFEATNRITHYSLKDQMQRAALSVINNIAEGFSRKSPKEKARFFEYATSSCNEVECMTFFLEKIGIVNKEKVIEIRTLCVEVFKMVNALSSYIRNFNAKQSAKRPKV